MSDHRLLVRPIPYFDEAPIGVLLRAAWINGWSTTSELLKMYGLTLNRGMHIDFLHVQNIFDLLGIVYPAEKLVIGKSDARGYFKLENGLSLPYSHLRINAVPVCVQCLQEKAYIRKWWTLRLICSCNIHKCSLLFVCPECKSTLGINRRGPCFCACGHDLCTVESTRAPAGCLYLHEALRRGYHRKIPSIGELFSLLEEADVTRVAQDIDWCDTAVALQRDEDRSVQMLVELVRHSSQREHPRLTLGGFLMRTDHVRQRALQALAQLMECCTGPPTEFDATGVVSWEMTKIVLGLSDGQLHAIWRVCLTRHSSEKSRHTFTRASVNGLLWRLSDPHSRDLDVGNEVCGGGSAASETPEAHISKVLAPARVRSPFDLVLGFSAEIPRRIAGEEN